MSGTSRKRSEPLWPMALALIAAGLLAVILAHVLLRMPMGFGDNFSEIADTHRRPLGVNLYQELDDVYFRPLEMVWRYLITFGLGEGIFGYNLFVAISVALMAIAFALVCHPRNGRDLAAFLVALAVLIGHHAAQATWEFNIIISNGLVLLAGIISIGIIGRPATFAGQVCALVMTLVCLLTKEVGLVVAGVFMLAHLLKMPGVRRATAIAVTVIVLVYLGYHLSRLPNLNTGEPGMAAGVGGYLSNLIAAMLMFWTGIPRDGNWARAMRFMASPWQWIEIAAGVATVLLLVAGWRLAPSETERDSYGAPSLDRRWFVLFGAAFLACSALSFYYARHRHGAPAVPLLAYCTYLSIRVVLWRIDCVAQPSAAKPSPVLIYVALVGLACAILWPLRVVTGFEFARALGATMQTKWHDDMPAYWDRLESYRRPFLVPFSESIDSMPWARRDVPILNLLGEDVKDSVNR